MDVCQRFSVLCWLVSCDGLIPRTRSPTKCPRIYSEVSKVKFWIVKGQRT
jgi:hypothetical protein